MEVDESLAREIVRRILSVTTPDKIVLFGSAAPGQITPVVPAGSMWAGGR